MAEKPHLQPVSCGSLTVQPTEGQPIALKFQGTTPSGELHYSRHWPDHRRGSYDVFVKVESGQTLWRLQEGQGKKFPGLKPCQKQTIYPNHLLSRECEEGACTVIRMVREGTALFPGKISEKSTPSQKSCSIDPAKPPTDVSLYFMDPWCTVQSTTSGQSK